MCTTTTCLNEDDDFDSFWDDDEHDNDNDECGNSRSRRRANAISARMPTVKELTAKIIKLERENFQLKLRVHLNGTRGTADPITAAAPKKSQREFQIDKDIQELRAEKEQLELRLEQNKNELEQEIKLKEQLIEREAESFKKYTQLKNYVIHLENEKTANSLHCNRNHYSHSQSQSLGRITQEPIPSPNSNSHSLEEKAITSKLTVKAVKVSRAVGDSVPLDLSLYDDKTSWNSKTHNFDGLSAKEWYGKYEQSIRHLQVTSRELKQVEKELESVNNDRFLLLKQLKTSEAIRKRESIAMEQRLKEALEELTAENKKLRVANEELKAALVKADQMSEISRKTAVQEMSSQLFYHQTALEKVHEEQALLIAELQTLKKSCPVRVSPSPSPIAVTGTAATNDVCKKVDPLAMEPELDTLARGNGSARKDKMEIMSMPITMTAFTNRVSSHNTEGLNYNYRVESGTNLPRFIRVPQLLRDDDDSTAQASISDLHFHQHFQKQMQNQHQQQYLFKSKTFSAERERETHTDLELQPSELEPEREPAELKNGIYNNDNDVVSNKTCDNEANISYVNKKLHAKNSRLAIKLKKTRESLKQAIALLEHSEKDKEGMEKIICRQLHRTHIILADVKDTLVHANANHTNTTNSNVGVGVNSGNINGKH